MIMQPPTTDIPRLRHILLVLILFFATLLPRVLDLGSFVTHDEVEFWLDRSEIFMQALQTGDYGATAVSTHPGVTTMWLGMMGIMLRRALRTWQLVAEVPFPLLLALMRLPVALAHTVGILAGYAMLRRLTSPIIAILAALLWACDPFIIGYSRLLHVDALMGTFATLSLLAALIYWYHEPRIRWLVTSAACGGLAILSKSPALLLLPMVGIIALAWVWEQVMVYHYSHQQVWLRAIGRLLAWGAICALTITILLPAVWADPMRVYELLRVGVEVEGANPHMTGNFFLGREDPAPGLRFYPVALALRTTPWTLAGLLLLPLISWRVSRFVAQTPHQVKTQRSGFHVRDMALLALWIILFVAAMSIFPKKFNRYIVPVFPALDILAAVGLVVSIGLVAQVVGTWASQVRTIAIVIISGAALVNVAWVHPYAIAYYNQALGGHAIGVRTFSVGWGEGLEQVAAWINAQENSTGVVTAAIMTKSINPYLRHGAQATAPHKGSLPDNTGYVVVSIYQAQGTVFPPFDQFYGNQSPVHTIQVHGVDYAWIYEVPPEVAHVRKADFGATIELRGYAMQQPPKRGAPFVLHLFWYVQQQPPPEDYWLFAHIIGEDGQRYGQVDMPYPTSTWQPHRYQTTELALTIPEHTPTGTYTVTLGMYHPKHQQRLPLTSAFVADPQLDGPHTLIVTTVHLDQHNQ
jgi:4-amino-4-deoxy-L-arabinose transferase-like glycosyltransferase